MNGSETVGVHPAAGDGLVTLQVLAFNDFHGNLEAPPSGWRQGDKKIPAGGVSHLAAHLNLRRREHKHSVVVSAGDLVGASPLISGLFHDEPTIEAMNQLGLDFNGVGNHEFDEGLAELMRLKTGGCHPKDGCTPGKNYLGAKFEFLAANVVFKDQPQKTIFPPYAVREYDGIKVAFIGMTLEATPEMLPPIVAELDFLAEAQTANRLVKKLKREGIETFVIMLHEGGFARGGMNGCREVSGPIVKVMEELDSSIDLIVTGHTHRAYNCTINNIRVTSAGSFGRVYTRVLLQLDPKTKDVAQSRAENLLVHHDIDSEAGLDSLVGEYSKMAAPLRDRQIGMLTAALTREQNRAGLSNLGQVIADAQLEATKDAGAELAFMNTGGIRTAISPVLGEDGLGPVTYGMLFSSQPFGNLLVTVTLSGEQVLTILKSQWKKDRVRILQPSRNLRYAWRKGADGLGALKEDSVTINKQPLDLKRNYRVTLNNYLANRGLFAQGRDRTNGIIDLDALVNYVQKRSPLTPPPLEQIQRLD